MREIKFRAWDIENKRWIDPMEVFGDWNKTPWFAVVTAIGETIQLNNDNGLIWVQYTGLKDKNGVEIYQGDILKVKADKEGYGDTSYEGLVLVTGDTCGYGLEPINPTMKEMDEQFISWDSSSMWHVGEGDTTEVVGNIHENPELLPTKPDDHE